MFPKDHIFTKEFEINIVDSMGFVLAIRPTEQTKEHVRYVMEHPDNDETTDLCLRKVLSALEEVQPGEGANPDHMSAKTIEEHLLTIPVGTFEETFDRLTRKYEDIYTKDKVPEGYVSGYYGVYSTMNELSAFFYYLKRHVREELKGIVGDAFGVRVPEADFNPEDVQVPFKSEDLPQPLKEEELQIIETEDPEFEFTPIY